VTLGTPDWSSEAHPSGFGSKSPGRGRQGERYSPVKRSTESRPGRRNGGLRPPPAARPPQFFPLTPDRRPPCRPPAPAGWGDHLAAPGAARSVENFLSAVGMVPAVGPRASHTRTGDPAVPCAGTAPPYHRGVTNATTPARDREVSGIVVPYLERTYLGGDVGGPSRANPDWRLQRWDQGK
jgi:hypothetical protein